MDITITLTFSQDLVEYVVRHIMENFPEASHGCALKCIEYHYKDSKFVFVDTEDGRKFHISQLDLMKAFPLLFTDRWPKGLTKIPTSTDIKIWNDWLCEADAGDFDAFAQLACLGEIIYG